ncbi:DUF1344 domain-containing protein [Pararhodobacter sp.]|uniref:DUF1344 domain-containing protein n=1 Tax=Pararhodobacter sp. TaxID=2127056 RepID=UPI002FE128E0
MRSKILPLALIASLGLGSAVLAAPTETTGVIKSIDAKAMTVELADGTTYHLPAGYDVKPFKVGEKVVVSWEMKGTLKEATALKSS